MISLRVPAALGIRMGKLVNERQGRVADEECIDVHLADNRPLILDRLPGYNFQTVEQRAERLLELERWELGLDEPLHWPERIARITPREVRRAARSHIHPDALCRVEYGPVRRAGRKADAECA